MKDHSLSLGQFALNRVAVAAAVAVLSVLPLSASALGLGKMNVKSALGEPLRAEIDINSLNSEESVSLQVRVASPDTYRAAGVDYNAVLSGANVVLQRRADGRPYLRITSNRPVQEPFVDVILDLGWSSGRLVREYTMLFDPPVARAVTPPAAPVLAVPAESTSPVPAVAAPKAERPTPTQSSGAKVATKSPQPGQSPLGESKDIDREGVKVRRGDSLSMIAERNLYAGVSLDQMLVGMYRQNPMAFQGDNMNRLRSGAVLTLPSPDKVKSISPAEARQFILAQSADFDTYRQRLASSVGVESPAQSQRQVSGKVEAEVRDRKQVAAGSADKLTLSKGSVSPATPSAEDRLAAARATQEAGHRVGELSKNLDDLRKLKEQAAGAGVGKSAVAPAVPSVTPQPAPSSPVAVVAPLAASVPASELVPSAAELPDAAASVTSQPELPVAASEPASVLEPVQAQASMPVPAPEVDQEGSGLLSQPVWLAAGVAVLALAGGVFAFIRSRRRADTGETSFLESRLQPDSFFGASGGQRVDTRDATAGPSSMSYSLSQLDAMGDVDPVAEADVYLAYGRDLQAEEILKEALRSTPDRLAVRMKLLEVYAKRRDTKGYESLAVQLFNLTNGVGQEWATAQEMGLSIDPENPLYQPGGQPAVGQSESVAREPLGVSTVPHSESPDVSRAEPVSADAGLDLDLGLDIGGPAAGQADAALSTAQTLDQVIAAAPPVLETPAGPLTDTSDASGAQGDIDFDLPIEPLPQASEMSDAPAAADDMTFDLADISLDEAPPVTESASAAAEQEAELPMADVPLSADPMARKFDLAQEFSQIGDVEGARELLQEVVDNAQDASLRNRAQTMLDSLG